MRDIYDDGSVLILSGSEVWVGVGQDQVEPTLVLFEIEPGTYIVEQDKTFGAAFERLEELNSTESFYFENSANFYKLDEMALLMLRMVL